MKIQNQQMIAFSSTRVQKNENAMGKTLERLSGGVMRTADNAAGLAISETLRAQVRGLSQAHRNMQDGLSVLEAVDEGLQHVTGLLQRGRELSVMSANGTLNAEDYAAAQKEMSQIMQGIDDTAGKLEFNTKKILGENAPLVLMVGATPGQKITINLVDTSTKALGLEGINLDSRENAEQALTKMDQALLKVSSMLTAKGADYDAIQHHMANANLYETNLTASVSKIKDTDMAKESLSLVTLGIRQQGDQLLVSQINQNVKDVLHLLK